MSLLRPIRETSAASVDLARERASTMGVRRLLVAWVAQAIMLLIVAYLIPGISV